MVIAALAATGTSQVENIHHIERGYEDVELKFKKLGADIKRVHVPDKVAVEAV